MWEGRLGGVFLWHIRRRLSNCSLYTRSCTVLFVVKPLLLFLVHTSLILFCFILSRRLGGQEVGKGICPRGRTAGQPLYRPVLGRIQISTVILLLALVARGPGRYWDVWSRLLFLTTWCLVSGIFVFLLRFFSDAFSSGLWNGFLMVATFLIYFGFITLLSLHFCHLWASLLFSESLFLKDGSEHL